MKRALALAILISSLGFQKAYADNAIGAVIGDPTGLSARFGLDNSHSIEGALAYSVGRYRGLHIHGTYLWDKARAFETTEGPLYMYYGIGARLISINHGDHDGDLAVAPRAPLGILYNFNNPNIEIFGELSLAIDLTPSTDVDIDAGIGVRIRF